MIFSASKEVSDSCADGERGSGGANDWGETTQRGRKTKGRTTRV